ncbi:MAG: hypothetical protein GYB66_00990 [Chloroflexi bacterium]|nr:hypothetical protein [Chloroflexota bacterium]
MDNKIETIEEARRRTAASLGPLFQSTNELTHLSLKDITELADEVARVLPAGNVVKMVFSQLRSIKGRRIPADESRRLLGLLHQGIATLLDRATYMAFYTTPALLISGYQLLLQAAGKDPQAAFTDGTWQFYLEFGLRADTARHACETTGFHQQIARAGWQLSEMDQLAAWIMAASWLVASYPSLLAHEWYEHMQLKRLGDRLGDSRMLKQWVKQRPYHVPGHRSDGYIRYRREVFATFVYDVLSGDLPAHEVDETLNFWHQEVTLDNAARAAYQTQMSLQMALTPEPYFDRRDPIPLEACTIAVAWNGEYYLVPIFHNGARLNQQTVRAMASTILANGPARVPTPVDTLLVHVPRSQQATVRNSLPAGMLETLRTAPIIINWNTADAALPLAEIRRGRRGIGDHALTLFRTDQSIVFDQSHIFFDAIWGMAIAEILTGQAIRHAGEMKDLAPIRDSHVRARPVNMALPSPVIEKIRRQTEPTIEVAAETETRILEEINYVRRLLKRRNSELDLTFNDLLVLYRSMHNQLYRPAKSLMQSLKMLAMAGRRQEAVVDNVRVMLDNLLRESPAFLIPIDATTINPRARIFPVTFSPQPPWTTIAPQHEQTWARLDLYREQPTDANWKAFSEARSYYLGMLRLFGALMQRYKDLALEGKSISTISLEFLGSVPRRLQPLLRDLPDHIDLLNDMLKGTEVFSNVGHVASTSSLKRFITAKDDNRKKELCWGVMTRADGTTAISLRDFRPQVTALVDINASDIALMITRDFLESYAYGLRQYVLELTEMAGMRKQRGGNRNEL